MLISSSNSGKEFHPLLDSIAVRIRHYRSTLPNLCPLDIDPSLGSIYGMLDGESLSISNELHSARGLRKLHLELASLGSGLQILHCVLFPQPNFDLPIFGADVVAGPAGISAAILDLSPVTSELPLYFQEALEKLDKPPFSQERELPAWGDIFSPYVHFIRPANEKEEFFFLDLVDEYLRILISSLELIKPDRLDSPLTIERNKGQLSYCLQQKRNDKTRTVLARAFNPKWADRYIEEVLFDCPLII